MTEANELKVEVDSLESDLDTVINSIARIPDLISDMEGKLLALNLGGLNTSTGIAMLETMKNSSEFVLNQGFVFRNELNHYREKL